VGLGSGHCQGEQYHLTLCGGTYNDTGVPCTLTFSNIMQQSCFGHRRYQLPKSNRSMLANLHHSQLQS
jgi:hypothetical protein